MGVFVQTADFDLGNVVKNLRDNAGAIVSFSGIVRNSPDGSLTALELECYPAMAQSALSDLRDQAMDRWNLTGCVIIHRYGTLGLGAQIMMVATAAPHRGDAFAGAEYLMDYLKCDAPFWKKEHTKSGRAWVENHATDAGRKQRWTGVQD